MLRPEVQEIDNSNPSNLRQLNFLQDKKTKLEQELEVVNAEHTLLASTTDEQESLMAEYAQASNQDKLSIFKKINHEHRNILWARYLQELDEVIAQYENNQHPARVAARNVYNKIKYYREHHSFSDLMLFPLLHKTHALMTTNVDSQEFETCSNEFLNGASKLKTQGRKSALLGAGAALVSLLLIASVAVLTNFLIVPCLTHATDILGAIVGLIVGVTGIVGDVALGLTSIASGATAIALFANAHKNLSLGNQMQALEKGVRTGPATR